MYKTKRIFGACALAVSAMLNPAPTLAFDASGFFDSVVMLSGHSCSFNLYHDGAGQETQVNMFIPGGSSSKSAGGNYWVGGAIVGWPGGDVTIADIETHCGISSVTNFVTDGANGSFASDDFIGVTFRGTSNADGMTYDYEIGVRGAGSTVAVNTRTVLPNNAPTAEAGPNQMVSSGASVTLDGSASDANDTGQTLTYAWSQTGGTTVALSSTTAVGPTFTAPTLVAGAADEVLTFQLIVNDGIENSAADTVQITVEAPPNTVPTAEAGPNQTVASMAMVTLTSAGSDANDTGQALSYAWSQTGGTSVALSSTSAASPTFTAPTLLPGDANAVLTFQLIVNDGVEDSLPDTVQITVTAPANVTPTAEAGSNQTVASAATVTLDGSASNANNAGQTLTYAWSQTSGVSVSLSSTSVVGPSFTAPTLLPGEADIVLIFQLIVNDGVEDSAADTVQITVAAPMNTAPTAEAGPNQIVASGASVTLDGSASDANDTGQSLTYAWSQIGGATVTLSNTSAVAPGFTAPTLLPGDADVVLAFQLIVNDGVADSAPDTVQITVTAPANTTPTADAGANQTVASGSNVTLDGSGSNANDVGQSLTYAWSQISGTTVALSSTSASNPSFTAPVLAIGDADLVLVFQLIVNDGIASSAADTVQITVAAPTDMIRPDVTLAASQTEFQIGDTLTITVTFSEPVTGFTVGDLSVANGTLSGFGGSGANYTATVTPISATAPVRMNVAEGVAADLAGNLNFAASELVVNPSVTRLTQEAIGTALEARARALINSQPNLRGFLTGGAPGFRADVTQGQGAFHFSTLGDAPLWVHAVGEWSSLAGNDQAYALLTFGSHIYRRDNFILGAMVQLDYADTTLSNGDFTGQGWLAGPYIVGRFGQSDLTYSASLLHGRSNNTLTLTGLSEGDFTSIRTLATFGVEGRYVMPSGLAVIPSLDLSYVIDEQQAYVDSLSNLIPSQRVEYGEVELGLTFEMPIELRNGQMALTGGLSGIYSRLDRQTGREEDGRARIDIGARAEVNGNTSIQFGAYADGIGMSDYEAFGVDLAVLITF